MHHVRRHTGSSGATGTQGTTYTGTCIQELGPRTSLDIVNSRRLLLILKHSYTS